MANFLSPVEVSMKLIEIGQKKIQLRFMQTFILGILAGAYIALGAQLSTVIATDTQNYLGFGVTKFLSGVVFSVGLMLVIIAGAELFTGNNLIVKACMKGIVGWGDLFKNWTIVYIANLLGALLVVFIMYYAGLYKLSGGNVGVTAVNIATSKASITFTEGFFRGVMCNWLVCLAVYMAVAGTDVVSKIFGIFFPIMAFVASGFEHSVANMYFIPAGMVFKTEPLVASLLKVDTNVLNMNGFINNLIPVTLGNIVGGAVFVGVLYYMAYQYACPAGEKKQ